MTLMDNYKSFQFYPSELDSEDEKTTSINYFALPINQSILMHHDQNFVVFLLIPRSFFYLICFFHLIIVLTLKNITFYFSSRILLNVLFLLKLHLFLNDKAFYCLFVEFRLYFLEES